MLDDISDFEEELKSAEIDSFYSEISSSAKSSATRDDSAAITVKEPQLQKKKKNGKRKKSIAKNTQRGGNDHRTKQSKQPTSQCSDVDAKLDQKQLQESKQAAGEIKWKTANMLTKKELGDVMLGFCIRAVVSTTRHEPFRNSSKVY